MRTIQQILNIFTVVIFASTQIMAQELTRPVCTQNPNLNNPSAHNQIMSSISKMANNPEYEDKEEDKEYDGKSGLWRLQKALWAMRTDIANEISKSRISILECYENGSEEYNRIKYADLSAVVDNMILSIIDGATRAGSIRKYAEKLLAGIQQSSSPNKEVGVKGTQLQKYVEIGLAALVLAGVGALVYVAWPIVVQAVLILVAITVAATAVVVATVLTWGIVSLPICITYSIVKGPYLDCLLFKWGGSAQ